MKASVVVAPHLMTSVNVAAEPRAAAAGQEILRQGGSAADAAMAISAAHFYGVPLAEIAKAMAAFEGVKRRQEVRGEVRGITIIDDFGHHPTAIRETLRGLRHQYPGRRLWAIFEPRSNTTRQSSASPA